MNTQIEYWKKSAERTWKAAFSLFKNKHYDSCLFFCHLTLEKILKGLVVKQTKTAVPYIHDLAELARIAQLEFSDDQIQNFRIITSFNISCRYDNIKLSFYKKCNKNYTEKYLNISKKLYLWLKKQYQKK